MGSRICEYGVLDPLKRGQPQAGGSLCLISPVPQGGRQRRVIFGRGVGMASMAAAGCTAPARAQAAAPVARVSVRPLGGVPALPRGSFLGGPLRMGPMVGASDTRMPKVALKVQAVAGEVMVDVDKPLGLRLAESRSANGGLVVKSASGNAAKAGIKSGDTVIYTSSYFGDELWPADNITFSRSALARCPSPVTIVFVRGENTAANVKRLPKRKAPPRFGRKLSPGQLELATHICVDCGYVYCQRKPFSELDPDWRCPQCNAPIKRFALYDKKTGRAKGGAVGDAGTLATLIGGLVGVGILAYVGLQF
ncbi:unnamed protein product [Ostreobium quekettii]|uniref:Rubredoxin-like domain-containing protein n=1 Tax=Ostreobium quekettii TaxID=121088 RepID=A0A8S1J1I1_9CHLO|nr:unnamed protein product [Ostreobium quekettii]